MKFSKFKERKGITLIALVITIIVLLILAGVTIAMIVGDNGILTRSNEAKQTTNTKKIQEEVDLEAADLVAEYHTKDSGEVTGSAGDYVATNIASKFANDVIKPDGTNPRKITVEKDGVTTTGTIQDDGHIDWDGTSSPSSGEESETPTDPSTPAATSTITATNYGEYVDIGVDINGTNGTKDDFRVFLNDGSNVYLIAADYVPYSMLPQSEPKVTGRTTKHSLTAGQGDYSAYWNSDILADYNGATDISENSLLSSNYNKWANRTDLTNYQKGRPNIKAVAYMLDTTAWGVKFKNSSNSSYINYVTGGPTLEQFAASYNAKHAEDTNFETAVKMNHDENNYTGYRVSRGSDALNTYSSAFSNADDNLYFYNKSGKPANYMWLASPSAENQDNVMNANSVSFVEYKVYTNNSTAFRPLVCLKSGVKLVEPETEGGAYILQ